MTDSGFSLARRTPWRGFLAFAAAAALAGALPLTALAAEAPVEKTFNFDNAADRRAWYWEKQQDFEVGLPPGAPTIPPPPPPLPAPPEPNQRQRLPNPQRPDTLPVAVYGGQHERMSALYFNLFERGVTAGSEISKLAFSIEESEDRNEWPSVNVDEAAIQACQITEFWAGADDPQVWATRPAFQESGCVEGKRVTRGEGPPRWTFDITQLSQDWGKDPFASNYGVMLLGVIPNDAGPRTSWQVNLKVPSRDTPPPPLPPGQEDVDEEKRTRDRVVVDLEFVPGEEPPPPPPPPGPTGIPPVDTGTTSSFTPTTDFTTTSTDTPLPTSSSPSPTPTEAAPVAAPVAETQPPQMPAYVWALLPAGLLALAAVRSVVLEPTRGTRPDGAIAAIRRRNAQRRGGPIREVGDPLAGAWAAAGRGVRRVGGAVTKTLRSLRRR